MQTKMNKFHASLHIAASYLLERFGYRNNYNYSQVIIHYTASDLPVIKKTLQLYFYSLTQTRSAHSFRLPDDKKAPILMVGPGTGIAPFRSFWQEFMFERQSGDPLQQRSGNTILYFGCRNPGIDDIYKEELEETQTCHAISKVYTAYSRIERKPKV